MESKDLQQIITNSPLSKTTKDFFAKKVAHEGATPANIFALKELLRAVQSDAFNQLGLGDNPKLQAAQAQLAADIKQATEDFNADLKRVEAQAKRVSHDIQEDLKKLEEIVISSAKSEA